MSERMAVTSLAAENWFVAQLKPQGLRLAIQNLDRQGFQHFCPKRLETTIKRGKPVADEKPLFPGYIFVQFDPVQAGWTSINGTRGVTRLILTDIRKPVPLPAEFMSGLMARCDRVGVVTAPTDLKIGDTIRVLSGPFAEAIARIEQFTDDERLQILMDLMGQKTRISVPRTKVEKL